MPQIIALSVELLWLPNGPVFGVDNVACFGDNDALVGVDWPGFVQDFCFPIWHFGDDGKENGWIARHSKAFKLPEF